MGHFLCTVHMVNLMINLTNIKVKLKPVIQCISWNGSRISAEYQQKLFSWEHNTSGRF